MWLPGARPESVFGEVPWDPPSTYTAAPAGVVDIWRVPGVDAVVVVVEAATFTSVAVTWLF